jgi:hypothetical protein
LRECDYVQRLPFHVLSGPLAEFDINFLPAMEARLRVVPRGDAAFDILEHTPPPAARKEGATANSRRLFITIRHAIIDWFACRVVFSRDECVLIM